ncbi:TPA: DNA-binding protein [Haemophilus influenzae]
MRNDNLKTHYSAKELLDLSLSCLPNSVQGIIYQAKKNGWVTQKRVGKGGGKEYALASLPQEIQTEIRTKFAMEIINAKPKALPVVKADDLKQLTTAQRKAADARMALVLYVNELEAALGSRNQAMKCLLEQAKQGELSDTQMAWIALANNKQGNGRVLGHRTLYKWVLAYHQCETAEQRLMVLAPGKRKRVEPENVWYLPWFMGCYRQTSGLTFADAYRMFEAEYVGRYGDDPTFMSMLPSPDQVRTAFGKLPVHIRELGRLTGSKYKNLLPYVERKWDLFKANDIWIGDGHSLKLKVAHPIHGSPFTPELTMIVDGASRKIVGWSLALSESGFAVLDALRHAISRHGVPCIYYSDNGGGEKNKMLDADVTGILPRFGIHHATGIAGNPQGRGIIERLNRTVGKRIAQMFPTYYGSSADQDTTRRMLQSMVSLASAKQGAKLTPKQRKAKAMLPTWDELMKAIEQVIDWYNNEHVHSEINCTPAEKYRRVTQDDLIVMLSEPELRDIERPHFIRKTQRGLVQWNNHQYFHLDLLNHQGSEVVVAVDIHNADFVQVRTKSGQFICNAKFEGHAREAFSVSMVEQQRQKRADSKLKRIQRNVDETLAELNPVITIEHQPDFAVLVPKVKQKIPAKPIFHNLTEKEEWEAEQAKLVNE